MHILYTRYSKDRNPHFQMKTVIYEQDGVKKVKKEAINLSGSNHIKNILDNYKKLSAHYTMNVLLEPKVDEEFSLIFDYISGRSLDELILEAVLNKNEKDFFCLLTLYKQLINNVAAENYTPFSNTEEFVHFFKKKYPLDGLNSFTISNVDLNLDNIFILENQQLKILDYEWVLDFPIPVGFVAFRAINTFYYAHYKSMINFVDIGTIFNFFQISSEIVECYIDMSIVFADYVGTNQATTMHKGYLKSSIPFEFKEPEVYYSQLFYKNTEEDLYSEQLSVKIGIDSHTRVLNFFVASNMNFFRFDPADKKSIIRIEKVIAFDSKNNTLELNYIYTNASFTWDSTFFFATDDPQVYYFVESDFEVSRIEVSLKYIKFIDDDLLLEFGEKYEGLLGFNSTLEAVLEKERADFNNEKERFVHESETLNDRIINYQLRIDEQQNSLRTAQDISCEIMAKLSNTEAELLDQKNLNNVLSGENSQIINENVILQNDLKLSKEYIKQIESTIWWRVSRKIISLGRKISGETKGKKK
ncbi:hypothetical protein [Paenibacillus sp. FSL H3-0333]|uniref:hypothetical protein n=1 Tax=Paenibacillus sp. FSL H3-0333 TaxID=2921373 RepID=UPI0030F7A9F4